MEYSFERADGDGYVARFDGTLDATLAGDFWTTIVDVRPEAGFAFGVLDIEQLEVPMLAAWPGEPRTLELLHPIARLATASVNPGFLLAIVTPDTVFDNVIEDLVGLMNHPAPVPPEDEMHVRRHDTVDLALDWCRSRPVG